MQVSSNDVAEYYGETLQTSDDLKTNACSCSTEPPVHIQEIMAELDDEILSRFYGCGSPIPEAVAGKTVLDLGCGTGRDVFILSKLVGEQGRVIGVDMTSQQLDVGARHVASMAEKFGYSKPNVEFKRGKIEELAALGIADESVDIVVSNCVINLSFDKDRVLSEIFRVLKPGGELYFSDVFSSRRLSDAVKNDPVLVGECIGGAYYTEDFRRALVKTGCLDYRVVSKSPIEVTDTEIKEKLGLIELSSITVRAFKLTALEDRCEDYGQVATYHGGIPYSDSFFRLDDHHLFEKGRPMLVCGNTAAMIEDTRFADYFTVTGDRNQHFGLFDCAPDVTHVLGQGACC